MSLYIIFPVEITNSKNMFMFAHNLTDFVLQRVMSPSEISQWLAGRRVININVGPLAQHNLFNRLPRVTPPTFWARKYEATLAEIRSIFDLIMNHKSVEVDLINNMDILDSQGLLLFFKVQTLNEKESPYRLVDVSGRFSKNWFLLADTINSWNCYVVGSKEDLPVQFKRTVVFENVEKAKQFFTSFQHAPFPLKYKPVSAETIREYLNEVSYTDAIGSNFESEQVGKFSEPKATYLQYESAKTLDPEEVDINTLYLPPWAALQLMHIGMRLSGGDLPDDLLLSCVALTDQGDIKVEKKGNLLAEIPQVYVASVNNPINPNSNARNSLTQEMVQRHDPKKSTGKEEEVKEAPPSYQESLNPINTSIRESIFDKFEPKPKAKNLLEALNVTMTLGATYFNSELRRSVVNILGFDLTNSDLNKCLYNNKDKFTKNNDGSWTRKS